jgi:two-component system OmpR family sensor kinase
MSSSPPTDLPRRNLARPSTWPLRTRLITALVLLLALVCLVVGVVTATQLRAFLLEKLDQQLIVAQHRAQDPPGGFPGNGSPPEFGPGQQEGTLIAVVDSAGNVQGSVFDPDRAGQSIDLPEEDRRKFQALPADDDRYTRDLGSALGSYRLVASMTSDNRKLVVGLPLKQVNDTIWRYTVSVVLVSGAALVAIGALGTVIIRRALRPLDRVAATAQRVSQLPLARGNLPELALSERVPDADTDPRTEVGQVGSALNKLLAHVTNALSIRQASEDRMRQFLADASHELRTPLASIRGYAELTRRVPAPVPDEVKHAVSRVESEAKRMGSLVDDLLLLARLDSGRPLASTPVDLTRLVIDAVSDARAAGPDHRWRLDLPEEEVSVTGDAPRLHQVLANLLANARTHTPAGTTVEVSLKPEPDGVTLVVRDDGPGIPHALIPDVFDRFTRADTSRSRAAGSSGLGLSIVAAVVAAHQGSVSVRSAPGCTEFTVKLPRTDARQSQPAHSSS